MGGRATLDLFANGAGEAAGTQAIGPDAWILRGFVADDREILGAIEVIRRSAPFRRMVTPGGRSMSVEMTNCGPAGWVSDTSGYRYSTTDPLSGAPWPQMPPAFLGLARDAAAAAGFPRFEPDACLINCYVPGTRLSLHQDKDERDFDAPIVSVSLGLPAMFLFGSARRAHRPARYLVEHGDVVVWGGASRRYFHGVARIDDGLHARLGRRRINLTFRKAL
jgi:alkylated DNA repair protein (DNA oxidative demethylase)